MSDQLVVDLLEEPIDEGVFRTTNKPGEKFRALLVDRGDQLSTKVNIVGITHGEMSDGENLATLLVFEMRHVATHGRRFKSATVYLRFEAGEGKPEWEPVVHDISPEGQWALNKTERVQNVKKGANAGIKAGIDTLGAEAGLVWEMEEVRTRAYHTTLTGQKKTIRQGHYGEENVVVWTVEENADKEDGIPTLVRGAVLLRRPHDVPFSFTVKVKADVDFAGKMKTLFGLEKKDPIDPVDIDPGKILKAGGATIRSLDPDKYDLMAMDSLDLKDVADVAVTTILDGAELQKRGVGAK